MSFPDRECVINHLRPWGPCPIGAVERGDDCSVCCGPATRLAWRISPDTVGGLPHEILLCDDVACIEDLAWENEQRLAAVWRLRDAELVEASAERAVRMRASWPAWARETEALVSAGVA